jgi:hypothetical protein
VPSPAATDSQSVDASSANSFIAGILREQRLGLRVNLRALPE